MVSKRRIDNYGFPRKINLLGIQYRLIFSKRIGSMSADFKEENLSGLILYDQQVIAIESSLSHEAKIHTLFHELVHAFNNHFFMGYLLSKHQKPELIIDQLGFCFMSLIKDNPALQRLWDKNGKG